MPDITEMSVWELQEDLAYVKMEIKTHQKLQAAGVKELHNKSIGSWIEHGEKIKAVIEKELERRSRAQDKDMVATSA